MNFWKICALIILLYSPFFAEEKNIAPLIEFKGGYFFFANSKMREIYPSGGGQLQLSGSYPLNTHWHIYGSVGFSEAWGRSLNFQQKTTLWQIPVNLGIKPILQINSFIDWYAAIGPCYFYVHQHNRTVFVDRNKGKSGIGLFANTGFNFYPRKDFFIDVFGEYSYDPIDFSSSHKNIKGRTLQVGGFMFGIGFGLKL